MRWATITAQGSLTGDPHGGHCLVLVPEQQHALAAAAALHMKHSESSHSWMRLICRCRRSRRPLGTHVRVMGLSYAYACSSCPSCNALVYLSYEVKHMSWMIALSS
jgi:hypothetical protein